MRVTLGHNASQSHAEQSRSLGPARPEVHSQKMDGFGIKGHWVSLLSKKYQTASLRLELTHFDLEKMSKRKPILHFGTTGKWFSFRPQLAHTLHTKGPDLCFSRTGWGGFNSLLRSIFLETLRLF